MTLQDLKELEYTTELEQEIKEIILNNVKNYDEPIVFFEDLLNYGCKSGIISELFSYADTVDFCKRHSSDINEVISDLLSLYDLKNIRELFADEFDVSDPLCINNHNLNLIAWFVFEETCRSVYDSLRASEAA